MDSCLQQENSIEGNETNLLQLNNISELLSKDYYEKFKMGQNLYEQSMTLSRLSLGDRTSEDCNNNTQIKMINVQERLSEELYKNQLLENKIQTLTSQLTSSIEHTTMLQKQYENKQKEIHALNTKLEKLNKNYDVEKMLNAQLSKKILDMHEQIKYGFSLSSKLSKHQKLEKSFITPKSQYSDRKLIKPPQFITSSRQKEKNIMVTEDSTVKDTSSSDLKSVDHPPHAATLQNFYKPTQNLVQQKQQQTSPSFNVTQCTLEKRIEATLSQIRAIKSKFQQIRPK